MYGAQLKIKSILTLHTCIVFLYNGFSPSQHYPWCINGPYAILPKSYVNKNSEYDQEIPQSQTADNPMAP